MISLRTYQTDAIKAILAEWARGVHSTMVAMATGTGKTETFLGALSSEQEAGNLSRALIIAHRKELVEQPRDRVARNWSHILPVPGIVMANQNDTVAQIVVATVQTLQSERRLAELLSHGVFSHVIIDECHHAVAPTYRSLIDALRVANPSMRLLGATATPKRTDGEGLRRVFNSVAYKISIKDAITKLKCLVPFMALGVQLPVDISGVSITGGDYNEEELGSVLMVDNAEEVIVETWRKHASGRQTMTFTASVAQAQSLSGAFNRAGIQAGWASGTSSRADRELVVNRYRAGELQVLVNCALWTEGVDIPETSCVAMVRPTRSDSVYVQAVGRGLRLAPGKTDCLILDFVPIGGRDLCLAGDLLGKPKEQKVAEQKAEDAGIILSAFGLASDGRGIDGDPDEVIVTALDLFAKQSDVKWTFDGRVSTASAGDKLSVAIVAPQKERIAKANQLRESGQWSKEWESAFEQIQRYHVYAINGSVERLVSAEDWQSALEVAENYIDENGDAALAKKARSWRIQPASPKQAALGIKIGVYREGISRGELAQAITHKFALSALRRSGALK